MSENKMTPLQERFKEAISNRVSDDVPQCENAAIDCEKIAEEFAEEFAVWFWLTEPKWKRDKLTTKQILQQFKEGRK